MKQTLIDKYMAGETTAAEERELKRLLQESTELSQQETSMLQLLSYEMDEDEEDIFAVDYTEDYEKVVHPRKTIRLWPFVAAACVAGALVFFLTPPKTDNALSTPEQPIAKVEEKPTETPEAESPTVVVPAEPTKGVVRAKANAPTQIAKAEVVKEEPLVAEVSRDPEAAAREFASSYSVSNPERLKYTPEEMEALKRQARKKYEEWIQLEREILEYDIKQTTALINNNEETK